MIDYGIVAAVDPSMFCHQHNICTLLHAAQPQWGAAQEIRRMFIGFQKNPYKKAL
jgi:hypothetical protein